MQNIPNEKLIEAPLGQQCSNSVRDRGSTEENRTASVCQIEKHNKKNKKKVE